MPGLLQALITGRARRGKASPWLEGILSGQGPIGLLDDRRAAGERPILDWAGDRSNALMGFASGALGAGNDWGRAFSGALQGRQIDRDIAEKERERAEKEAQEAEAAQVWQNIAGMMGQEPGYTPPTDPASFPAADFGGDQQAFIEAMMPYALQVSQQTGIDPRIIIAQAAQETGWGQHVAGNNYFGIKSHGQAGGLPMPTTEYVNGQPQRQVASFRQYPDMGASVAGYGEFMMQNPRYEPMRAAQGLDAQLAALGQSGYATDPNYANAVGQIARGIQLPADQRDVVMQLLSNPLTAPLGQQMLLAELTGGGGEAYTLGENETRFGPDNRPIAFGAGVGGEQPTGRPLTAQERVMWGIPEDDRRIWAMGEDGVPKVVGNAPEQRETPFADEESLRDNFRAETGDYRLIEEHFERLSAAAANPSAAGDIAMIFAFMKMLDPASVVRESEFNTAQFAAAVPEQIRSIYNRVVSGERLTDVQRADFLTQAQAVFDATASVYNQRVEYWRAVARSYGLDPDRVTPRPANDPLGLFP